ncbi:hypothetical protein HETIRDRAFT_389241, partial [Heterobasidion irregulare TC 32-1]
MVRTTATLRPRAHQASNSPLSPCVLSTPSEHHRDSDVPLSSLLLHCARVSVTLTLRVRARRIANIMLLVLERVDEE